MEIMHMPPKTKSEAQCFYATRFEIQVPNHVNHIKFINEDGEVSNGLHAKKMEEKITDKDLIQVGVGDYNIGKNLYTTGLGPCQAVLVRFKSGECGIYHASTPYPGIAFQAFKQAYQNRELEVDEIIIVEKTNGNKNNRIKAPYLTVVFGEHFDVDPSIVKRALVLNYSDVAFIDGNILICRDVTFKNNMDKSERTFLISPGEKVDQFISYDDTYKLFLSLKGSGIMFFRDYEFNKPSAIIEHTEIDPNNEIESLKFHITDLKQKIDRMDYDPDADSRYRQTYLDTINMLQEKLDHATNEAPVNSREEEKKPNQHGR